MAQIDANGINIEYDDRGSGEPLLMVMGLGGQLVDWPDDFVDVFVERGFRVIRFDNRDIGLSTAFHWKPIGTVRLALSRLFRRTPKSGYQISDMADDAAGLLDAIGVDSAHVIGVSMGGMIGQALAIQHPTKVRSLTSIMSNTGDGKAGQTSAKLLAKMVRLPAPDPETAVDQAVQIGRYIAGAEFDERRFRQQADVSFRRSFRPAGVARQLNAIIASPDRTSQLATVEAPTLVVHGLMDELVLPSGGLATAAAISGSRLLMFPDMGHDLPRARWAELADAVRINADRAAVTV